MKSYKIYVEEEDFQKTEMLLFSLEFPMEVQLELHLIKNNLISTKITYHTEVINGKNLLSTN